MIKANRSGWNSPIVSAVVVAWAVLVAIVFYGMRLEALVGLAFPILLGVACMAVGAAFDWLARRPPEPMAHFNFGVAIVLAFLSLAIVNLVFQLFGRQ